MTPRKPGEIWWWRESSGRAVEVLNLGRHGEDLFAVRQTAERPANAHVKISQPATHRAGARVEKEVECHIFEQVGMKVTAKKPNVAAGRDVEYVYLPWDVSLWAVSQEETARLRHSVLDSRAQTAAEYALSPDHADPDAQEGGDPDAEAEQLARDAALALKLAKLEKVRAELNFSTAKKPPLSSPAPPSGGLSLEQIMDAVDARAAERVRRTREWYARAAPGHPRGGHARRTRKMGGRRLYAATQRHAAYKEVLRGFPRSPLPLPVARCDGTRAAVGARTRHCMGGGGGGGRRGNGAHI